MKNFLLIIRGEGPTDSSPEQMQQMLEDYKQWAGSLGEAYVDGQRLENTGVLLESKDTITTDGPFLEAKEIIAGYVIVQTGDFEQAVDIAKNCPLADHCQIEVRPVLSLPN